MSIINLTGLKGLSALGADEQRNYMNRVVQMGLLGEDAPFDYFDRIYRNDQFIQKYGKDKFNSIKSDQDRDFLYMKDIVNPLIEEKFKDDPQYELIKGLTPQGKLELLENNYLSQQEFDEMQKSSINAINKRYEKQQEDGGWSINMPIDPMTNSPSLVALEKKTEDKMVESNEDARQKLLEDIIERDNIKKLEIAAPEADNLYRSWQQAITAGKMDQNELLAAFDKLAERKEIEGTTVDGRTYKYTNPGLAHYNAFKDEIELADYTPEEKMKLLAKYYVMAEKFGEGQAQMAADADIQNYIAGKQDGWMKTKLFLGNLATGTTGALMADLNGFVAMGAAMTGGREGEAAFLQSDWAKYWDGVDKYNTFSPTLINQANENNGVSPNQRIRVQGEEMGLNYDTLLDMAAMAKFIAPMLIMRGGFGLAHKGVEAAKTAYGATKFVNFLGKATAVGETLAGTSGISNMYAMGTYEETLAENNANIDRIRDEKISEDIDAQLNTSAGKARIQHMANMIQQQASRNGESMSRQDAIDEATRQAQTQLYYTMQPEYEKAYAEDRHQAELAAADSYMVNATVEAARMAAENALFRKWMLSQGTKANLGMSNPYLRVENVGGELTTLNKVQNVVKPILNNAWGGFESNYMDDVTARLGKEFGLSKMDSYLLNKYDPAKYVGTMDNFMGHLIQAGAEATEAFGEKQSWWDGFIGLGGSLVQGVPAAKMFKLAGRKLTTGEAKLANGETWSTDEYGNKKSLLERINNVFYNPILKEIGEAKQRERNTENRIAKINTDIEENKDKLVQISELFGANSDEMLSRRTGDMLQAVDKKNAELFSLVNTYETLMADPIASQHSLVQKITESVERASQATNANQVAEMVQAFLGKQENQNVAQQDDAVEVAFNAIKENAKKFNDMRKKIQNIRKKFENTYDGRIINGDIKDELAYQEIMMDNWKERLDKITSELGLNPSPSNSAVAQYGSQKVFNTKIEAQKEMIKGLQEAIDSNKKDLKDKKKKSQMSPDDRLLAKRHIQTLQESLSRAKTKLESMQKLGENAFDEKGQSTDIKTAGGMAALSLDDLNYMLDNQKEYSEAQQQEIKTFLNELQKKDPEARQKIRDAKTLQERIERTTDVYNRMLKSPTEAALWNQRLKDQSELDKVNLVMQRSKEKTFDTILKAIADNETQTILGFPAQTLKDFKERYPEYSSTIDTLLPSAELKDKAAVALNNLRNDKVPAEEVAKIISEKHNDDVNSTNLFTRALLYLDSRGINPYDINKAVQALSQNETAPNGDTVNSFKQYLDTLNQGIPVEAEEYAEYTSVNEVVSQFKDTMETLSKMMEEKEANSRTVDTDETTTDDSKPETPPDPQPEQSNNAPQEQQAGKPGIFGKAFSSAEQGHTDNDGNPIQEDDTKGNGNEDNQTPQVSAKPATPSPTNPTVSVGTTTNRQSKQTTTKTSFPTNGQTFNVKLNGQQKEVKISDIDGEDALVEYSDGSTEIVPLQQLQEGYETQNFGQPIAPIIQSFVSNSNNEVGQGVQQALTEIINDPSVEQSAKQEAIEEINKLKDNEFDDQNKLKQAITNTVNRLKKDTSNANNDQIAYVLERGIEAIGRQERILINTETSTTSNQPINSATPAATPQGAGANMTNNNGPAVNVQSNTMATVNLEQLMERQWGHPVAQFLSDHGVEQFLQTNYMSEYPDIMYVVDPQLTEDVKNDMGNRYTDAYLPIVAVVEHPSGAIVIGGTHYQPIGIMPSNENANVEGSGHMKALRDRATGATETQLLKDTDGKVITTKPGNKGGGVKARPVDTGVRTNSNISTIINNEMSRKEQEDTKDLNKKDKRDSAGYKRIKTLLMHGLAVQNTLDKVTGKMTKNLVFRQKNLKNDRTNNIFIFRTPISRTLSRDGNETLSQIIDAISNNTEGYSVENAINFNTRTQNIHNAVNVLLKSFPTTIDAGPELITVVNNMASNLAKALDRNITIDNKYQLQIVQTDQKAGEERIYNIQLVNRNDANDVINLGEIYKGIENNTSEEQVTYNILKGIIDANTAKSQGKYEFARWQLDYGEVTKMEQKNNQARKNVESWIDDGIIEAPATRLSYKVQSVTMANPFRDDGSPRFASTVTTNTDNANPTTPIGDQKNGQDQTTTSQGGVVDSNTGATYTKNTSNDNGPSQAKITAQQQVEKIINRSKDFKIQIDPNGYSYYVDATTGEKYARVTSIISADEKAVNRFGTDNMLKDAKGRTIVIYRGYALNENREATDLEETVGNTAADYAEPFDGFKPRYHFTSSREEAKDYAKTRTNRSEETFVDSQGEIVTQRNRHYTGDYAQISAYYISNDANVVTFEDINDYNKNKERARNADIVVLKKGTMWADNSEYIVTEKAKNKIIRQQDIKSNWEVPSTNIGTGFDEFVRDFFGDNLKDYSQYPNATPEQLEGFKQQLTNLRRKIEANGETVVSRDVVASGTIMATDAEGKQHPINIAGTIDLLTYDTLGNFRIYDMKTLRDYNTAKYKKEKWSQQLSLYKKFLENTYGIRVTNLAIIPIEVVKWEGGRPKKYPDPNQATYSLESETNDQAHPNQLLINGQKFTVPGVNLKENIPIQEYKEHILFERMTNAEQGMSDALTQALEEQQGNVQSPIQQAQVDMTKTQQQVDPVIGLPMADEFSDFGDPALQGMQDFSLGDLSMGEQMATPAPSQWANLEQGFKDHLKQFHVTEENWKDQPQELKDHYMRCYRGQ